jgi:hypothetical protein
MKLWSKNKIRWFGCTGGLSEGPDAGTSTSSSLYLSDYAPLDNIRSLRGYVLLHMALIWPANPQAKSLDVKGINTIRAVP